LTYTMDDTQFNYIDVNTGDLTIPDNAWLLWDQTNPVVCPKNKDLGPVFPTQFSQTQKRGWYLLFIPAPGDSDQRIYNTIDLYYDDTISAINTSYASIRNIRIDPVNDAPVISTTSGTNGNTLTKISYDKDVFLVDPQNYNGPDIHVDGTASISAVVNTQTFLPINVFDEESTANDRLLLSITLSSKNKGTLSYKTSRGDTVTLGTNGNAKEIDVSMSLTEMKTFFTNQLKFLATEQGTFTVSITVNDTGAPLPGTCEPGNPNFQTSLRTKFCPRISKAILTIIAQNNAALVTGAAVGVGAGVLALAAVGALLGGKFLKPKETDAWTEWDEDKLGDVALKNPFYQQETNVKASGIFQGK